MRCSHPARLTSSPLILSTLPALSPASPQAMSPAILVLALLQQSRAAPLDPPAPGTVHGTRCPIQGVRCITGAAAAAVGTATLSVPQQQHHADHLPRCHTCNRGSPRWFVPGLSQRKVCIVFVSQRHTSSGKG